MGGGLVPVRSFTPQFTTANALAHDIFEWSSMWKPTKNGMRLVATSRLSSHKFGISCLSDPSVTIGIVLTCLLRNASYLLKASPKKVIKASSRVEPLV